MALAHDIRHAETGFSGIASFFSGLKEAIARRKVYRQTLEELNALTARELDDLGLHRSMITRVAFEAAYGK